MTENPCGRCKGKGEMVCVTCLGSLKERKGNPCKKCKGRGKLGEKKAKCPKCKGDKFYGWAPDYCDAMCDECTATGWVMKGDKCKKCEGTGVRGEMYVDCTRCDGKGSIKCTLCCKKK